MCRSWIISEYLFAVADCHETGHLRKTCKGRVEEEISKNTALHRDWREFDEEVNSFGQELDYMQKEYSSSPERLDTLSGKLSRLCPTLYNSLTLMEKVLLDSSSLVVASQPVELVDSGGDRGLPAQNSLGSPTSTFPVNDEQVFPNTTLSPPYFSIDQPTLPVDSLNYTVHVEGMTRSLAPTFVEVVHGASNSSFDRPVIPGYQESQEGDSSLSTVLDSLIPYLRDNCDPNPLPTYLGNRVVIPSSIIGDLGEASNSETEPVKAYAWSRGLGIEYSPIKTRSTRKKLQATVNSPSIVDPSSSESGALRAVKDLARAK
jgi:hypothetical protein